MTSFLITWKPASENPEKGWPLAELQKVVRKVRARGQAVEPWRFAAYRTAKLGDRVFLLQQGRRGPAIIGYGEVGGQPAAEGSRDLPVKFHALVDPTVEVFATAENLRSITAARRIWGTQASGIALLPAVATLLERLVVGRTPIGPRSDTKARTGRNPPWSRDELILALELYFRVSPLHTSEKHPEIQALSDLLNRLPIHPQNTSSFRNANGVYMKLCNFLRLDPSYKGKGLDAGSKVDEEVWREFANDRKRLDQVAMAIRSNAQELTPTGGQSIVDPDFEAAEGRVLMRTHLARERDPRLSAKKKRYVLDVTGRLACEVCGFDFAVAYGGHGAGYAECHHRTPLSQLKAGTKTKLSELAVVCANCHRMLHWGRHWMSTEDLTRIRKSVATSYT